jgi:hypothetical protein
MGIRIYRTSTHQRKSIDIVVLIVGIGIGIVVVVDGGGRIVEKHTCVVRCVILS